MQMNRMEHDLWVQAAKVACPECKDACAGKARCMKLAVLIAGAKEELRGEKDVYP